MENYKIILEALLKGFVICKDDRNYCMNDDLIFCEQLTIVGGALTLLPVECFGFKELVEWSKTFSNAESESVENTTLYSITQNGLSIQNYSVKKQRHFQGKLKSVLEAVNEFVHRNDIVNVQPFQVNQLSIGIWYADIFYEER